MTELSNGYNLQVLPYEGRKAYILFNLALESHIVLSVINAADKEVRLLINEPLTAGRQRILFSYGNLEPEEYRIRLMINNDDTIDIENFNFKIS